MMAPLKVEDYLSELLSVTPVLPTQVLPLPEALGRVCARDYQARFPVPPFTNSAMDGFAVRFEDLTSFPLTLQVAGEVAAGASGDLECGPGQAIRIMTGAPLPKGADTVVPVELTDQPAGAAPLPQQVVINEPVKPQANVRRQGENVQVGDPVFPAGQVLSATALSALASVGFGDLEVFARPRVAVISTGDELVAAGEPLGPGQIPDSNSVLLRGLLQAAGYEVEVLRTSSDTPDDFAQLLASVADDGFDVAITTGGVSAGAYDVVKAVTAQQGFSFHKVAMQPGKPQGFGQLSGRDRKCLMLALPGNPVSVFVSFHTFVVPILGAMQGIPVERLTSLGARGRSATFPESFNSPAGRRQFVPVRFDNADTSVVERTHTLGSGSHLVASLPLAEGLAIIPEDWDQVEAGVSVPVLDLRLPWF
ncbi:hypothetical protein BSR28_01145 [Boudabousia liubingyangii]|nr:hypothetical protein BSR28_01145 [Boudabousia liubingyangii]